MPYNRRVQRFFLSFLICLPLAADSVWVELAPDGKQIVRAIREAPDAACPLIDTGGNTDRMQVRVKPQGSLNVLVCETALPIGAKKAKVDGRPVPLLKHDIRKILIMGDTGCRLVERGRASQYQNCNDPNDWAFPNNAARGASLKPDLVIHVGDYLYRESSCPKEAGCAGTPAGNGWAGWKADFFQPAEPLLRSAPWIFVRGNHEDCKRAWDGWFRFLHPGPMPASNCEVHSKPYIVKAGRFQFVVMDSTIGSDDTPRAADVSVYEKDFGEISSMQVSKAWLLTHRPLWGIRGDTDQKIRAGSATIEAAWRRSPAQGIAGILAGHTHAMEWVDFGSRRPVQFVVGNSGTKLIAPFEAPKAGFQVDGVAVESATVRFGPGYAVLSEGKRGISVKLIAGNEKQDLSCRIESVVTCVRPK